MGRRGLSCDREEFSPHRGLQRSLGPESDLAWREGYESEGSGVKCLCRLPPSTKFGSPSKDSRVQSVVPENAAQIWDDKRYINNAQAMATPIPPRSQSPLNRLMMSPRI